MEESYSWVRRAPELQEMVQMRPNRVVKKEPPKGGFFCIKEIQT
jgi:hypothetical protein